MTVINHNVLRKELGESLRIVDEQIAEIKAQHVNPYALKNEQGEYVLVPLIVAKANIYCALVQLNQPRDRR
jgi:hypothetical protein